MTAAHEQGVWHRDLKPDNILIRREGERFFVKIIDFGLALRLRWWRPAPPKARADRPRRQRRWHAPLFGTEQLDPQLGLQAGPHSDVYAFGKTSWFALFKTTMPRETQKQSIPALAAAARQMHERTSGR